MQTQKIFEYIVLIFALFSIGFAVYASVIERDNVGIKITSVIMLIATIILNILSNKRKNKL